jgi:hypothetical protein
MNSPLTKFMPDTVDTEALKRDGWQDNQILVIAEHDERLSFVEREYVRLIGERLYGRKRQGNDSVKHKHDGNSAIRNRFAMPRHHPRTQR